MNKCLNFSGELITSIKIFEEELELTRRVLATSNFELIEIADVDNVQISETWKHAITNDYLRLEIGKQDAKDTSEPPATLKDVVDELLDLWIELRAIRNSITENDLDLDYYYKFSAPPNSIDIFWQNVSKQKEKRSEDPEYWSFLFNSRIDEYICAYNALEPVDKAAITH